MDLLKVYRQKQNEISQRLNEFKNLKEEDYLKELVFCLLTPQSNAKKCWFAVEEIFKLKQINEESIKQILKSKTRLHNNKAGYVLEAMNKWDEIKQNLNNSNITELRNYLADNIKGYGLKEASHFLRNIGKSNNKIAILDRHILNNLISLDIIQDSKIKNKAH